MFDDRSLCDYITKNVLKGLTNLAVQGGYKTPIPLYRMMGTRFFRVYVERYSIKSIVNHGYVDELESLKIIKNFIHLIQRSICTILIFMIYNYLLNL